MPLTDVLRQILKDFETTAAAALYVERLIHTGQLRLYVEQVDLPHFLAPPLPEGDDWADLVQRIHVHWPDENQPAEITSLELWAIRRCPWFGYVDREDVDKLRLCPEQAAAARRGAPLKGNEYCAVINFLLSQDLTAADDDRSLRELARVHFPSVMMIQLDSFRKAVGSPVRKALADAGKPGSKRRRR